MDRFGDQLLQFAFPSRRVHRQLNGCVDQGRKDNRVRQLDRMNPVLPGHQQWLAVQNRVNEVLYDRRVRGGGVFERNVHHSRVGLAETLDRGLAEFAGVFAELRELKPAILEQELAKRADDFEAIGAGRFAS